MSRPLALFLAGLFSASALSAQVCTTNFWKNDNLPDVPSGSSTISIIPGLCEGEAIGSIFTMAPGSVPQKLKEVAVGFGHSGGGSGFQATCNVEIYEGPVTFSGSNATLGTKIFDLGVNAAASMQLSSTGVNTLDVSPYNITVSDTFVVAFRMNININGNCTTGYPANFFTDNGSGPASCTPGVNLIDELSGGWIDPATATISGFPLCPIFYAGNWVIRACSEDDGTAASTTSRNGSGCNPNGYASITPPKLGTSWITTVDIATPGAFASAIGVVSAPPIQLKIALGELLIDATQPFIGGGPNIGFGAHSIPIPNDASLIGLQLYSQAATIKPGPIIQLNNAIDLTIGI